MNDSGKPLSVSVRKAVKSTPSLVIGVWLLWGTAFIGIKIGLTSATPEAFAVLRVGAAVVTLGLTLVARRSTTPFLFRDPEIHRNAIPLGILQIGMFYALQNSGMVAVGAGFAAVVVYTFPLMVGVGAHYFLNERLNGQKVVGLLVGWLGVYILMVPQILNSEVRLSSSLQLLGAAVCWAAGSIYFKRVPARVPMWPLLFWMNVYGCILLLIILAFSPTAPEWGAGLLAAVLWTGIASGVGGVGLQLQLLRRGEASVASTWIFAVPVVSTLVSVVALHEELPGMFYSGGILVGVGTFLVSRSSSRIRRK